MACMKTTDRPPTAPITMIAITIMPRSSRRGRSREVNIEHLLLELRHVQHHAHAQARDHFLLEHRELRELEAVEPLVAAGEHRDRAVRADRKRNAARCEAGLVRSHAR